MSVTRNRINDIADGLEIATGWLRRHQHLQIFDMDEDGNCYKNGYVTITVFESTSKVVISLSPNTKTMLKEIAQELGTFSKDHNWGMFTIQQQITKGPSVVVKASLSRDLVCERRQVGTKMVTKPAPNAPTVEVEEPVFEYDCTDALLAKGKSDE